MPGKPVTLKSIIILGSLLALFTLATYWQVWTYDFVPLDDNLYVYRNPIVLSGITTDSIVRSFTTSQAGFWMPLTWLSLMLDHELYGLQPGGYHLTNLLFHLANTTLLLLLLNLYTGSFWRSSMVAALLERSYGVGRPCLLALRSKAIPLERVPPIRWNSV